MEAHSLLKKQGFDVSSYGTGAHVKLPGPSLREPNVYDFGTPYKHMFEDLRRKDPELYPLPFFYMLLNFQLQQLGLNKQTNKKLWWCFNVNFCVCVCVCVLLCIVEHVNEWNLNECTQLQA